PPDYIALSVAALEQTGADNVGPVIVTRPADGNAVARAIAVALSHPFGVGNSHFRIGSRERRWVDTVPFGCFHRRLFDQVGMFDEELPRNQDDEFNFRLAKHGARVLLEPRLVAYYYARGSIRQVARMWYQYGYFKPLVAKKVRRVMTLRQLVPACFVLGLVGTAALSPWLPVARVAFGALGLAYAALAVGCGLAAPLRIGRSTRTTVIAWRSRTIGSARRPGRETTRPRTSTSARSCSDPAVASAAAARRAYPRRRPWIGCTRWSCPTVCGCRTRSPAFSPRPERGSTPSTHATSRTFAPFATDWSDTGRRS